MSLLLISHNVWEGNDPCQGKVIYDKCTNHMCYTMLLARVTNVLMSLVYACQIPIHGAKPHALLVTLFLTSDIEEELQHSPLSEISFIPPFS